MIATQKYYEVSDILEYAKEKGITLIEIPYTYDTYEKEEKYLFQVGVLE